MLKKNERTVVFYDLKLVLPHRAGDQVDLKVLLQKFKDRAKTGTASMGLEGRPDVRISLRDVEFFDDFAVMLFRVSDKSVGNPAFENQDTGDLRVVEKEPPEGVGIAAHLVVRLAPKAKISSLRSGYRTVLEHVDSVGKTKIEDLLNNLATSFPVTYDVNGESDSKAVRFQLFAHTSKKLKAALAADGAIDEVVLVENKPISGGIDVPEGVKPIERKLRFKVAAGTSIDKVVGMVKGAFKAKKDAQFDYVKVRYHLDEKHTRTLNIRDEGDADFVERMIAEEAVIETTAALDQCHGCIVPELYEKMIQLVKEKD